MQAACSHASVCVCAWRGGGGSLRVGDPAWRAQGRARGNARSTVQADGPRGHRSESKQDKQGSKGVWGLKTGQASTGPQTEGLGGCKEPTRRGSEGARRTGM